LESVRVASDRVADTRAPSYRVALGISYSGTAYEGWQSQLSGKTVQDKLEAALASFCGFTPPQRVATLCAGRTDSGVHGLMQVVHFDTEIDRLETSWVRGVNALLPRDIAIQWARIVPSTFHCRASAIARRYAYVLLQSPVRPSIEGGRVGWFHRPLNGVAMQQAADMLLGAHDFSSFRAAQCQALSPIKTMHSIHISQRGAYYRIEFEASAFLHHMIRNIMGCLVAVGQGAQTVEWMQTVLDARSRKVAAPTFSPDGLYFLGPVYDAHWRLPSSVPAYDWLP
jgi:tRNA pseudouridine38-40 synthase